MYVLFNQSCAVKRTPRDTGRKANSVGKASNAVSRPFTVGRLLQGCWEPGVENPENTGEISPEEWLHDEGRYLGILILCILFSDLFVTNLRKTRA